MQIDQSEMVCTCRFAGGGGGAGRQKRGHVHFPVVAEIGIEMPLICIAVTWLFIYT